MSGSGGGNTVVNTAGKVYVQNLVFDENSITPVVTQNIGDKNIYLTTNESQFVNVNK